MANLPSNTILQLSGTVGDLVFKHRPDGRIVVSKRPDMSRVIPSERQIIQRKRFKEAVNFAKQSLQDPEKEQALKSKLRKGQCAFRQAMKAAFKGKG